MRAQGIAKQIMGNVGSSLVNLRKDCVIFNTINVWRKGVSDNGVIILCMVGFALFLMGYKFGRFL